MVEKSTKNHSIHVRFQFRPTMTFKKGEKKTKHKIRSLNGQEIPSLLGKEDERPLCSPNNQHVLVECTTSQLLQSIIVKLIMV